MDYLLNFQPKKISNRSKSKTLSNPARFLENLKENPIITKEKKSIDSKVEDEKSGTELLFASVNNSNVSSGSSKFCKNENSDSTKISATNSSAFLINDIVW